MEIVTSPPKKNRAKRPKRHRHATKRRKSSKEAIWKLRKADGLFSGLIRERDKRCLFPGCKVADISKLQCSHYFGRSKKATRFDFDNCISLCWLHHFKDKMLGYEYQKQRKEIHGWDGQYTLFMKNHLGEEKFAALLVKSEKTIKQSVAIKEFMLAYQDYHFGI